MLAILLALAWPEPAAAQQVRRCTGPDGRVVMTDKPCAAIGANERVPRHAGQIATMRQHRGGCARDLESLSFEIAAAIDLQDANRLAGFYHWPGQNSQSAYRIMGRLETIVRRQLLDIGPAGGEQTEMTWEEDADGRLTPVYPRPKPPTGLRIVQASGRNDTTGTATVFGLRRHMGCLWITL